MGQAKRRGTFEQRKAQSIAKSLTVAEEQAISEREQAEVLATLLPEQRRRIKQSSAVWKAVVSAALAASLTKR